MIASDLTCPGCGTSLVLSERTSRRTARLIYDCRVCSRRFSYASGTGGLIDEERLEESGPRTARLRPLAASGQETLREYRKPTLDSALPTGMNLVLEITDGPLRGKALPIGHSRCVIGREEGEIVIDDPLVSRRHAVIEIFDADTIILRDLASTNGTYHNGRLIDHCKVHDGDEVRFGSTILSVLVEKGA